MTTPADLEQWLRILKEARTFPVPKTEFTFFDISGRGHYENPLSDLLAFFMDPRREHGLGTRILEAFFKTLHTLEQKYDRPSDLTLIGGVEREAYTEQGNRIDIFAMTRSWALVIETKVWHTQDNPLDDYVKYAIKRLEKKESICKVIKVILCPNGKSEHKGWTGMSFRDLACAIRTVCGNSSDGKWTCLAKELALHMEQLGERIMDDNQMGFFKKNYHDVHRMNQLCETFLSSLLQDLKGKLESTLGEQDVEAKVENWGGKSRWLPALWFAPESWRGMYLTFLPAKKDDGYPAIWLYAPANWGEKMLKPLDSVLGKAGRDAHSNEWSWDKSGPSTIDKALKSAIEIAQEVHAVFQKTEN